MKIPVLFLSVLCLGSTVALAAPRDVQILSVDFPTEVVELFNFGGEAEPLNGWRFCTHDGDETFRYSGVSGLNGVSVPAGESFYIHWKNDAPALPNHINRSTIGGNFATPLSPSAYGMGLYWQTPFGTGANLADHVQWSIDGVDNTSADERSDEAEVGGVWVDQTKWVHTEADSSRIHLTDFSGAELHDERDYTAVGPDVLGWWRYEENGMTNLFDISGKFEVMERLDFFLPGTLDRFEERPRADLFEDGHEIRNHWAVRTPVTEAALLKEETPLFEDWTVETIAYFSDGGEFVAFMHIDEGNSVGTSNSSIEVGWTVTTNTQLATWLRDQEQQEDTVTFRGVGQLEPDRKWHHTAFVKQGTNLLAYVDYQLIQTTGIDIRGDGKYQFSTNHNMKLGSALNNANSSSFSNIFDEVRMSVRALEPHEFLGFSHPILIDRPPADIPDDALSLITVSGQTYNLFHTMDPVDTNTATVFDTFVATDERTPLSIPPTLLTNQFIIIGAERVD